MSSSRWERQEDREVSREWKDVEIKHSQALTLTRKADMNLIKALLGGSVLLEEQFNVILFVGLSVLLSVHVYVNCGVNLAL